MLLANYDLPRDEEQERKLRILVATALRLSCDYQVWPAPYLGPGGLVLHIYTEDGGRICGWNDPFQQSIDGLRYLLANDIEAEALALPDPRP